MLICRSLGERLALTAAPAVPFLVQSTLSAGIFVSGLYATQVKHICTFMELLLKTILLLSSAL
jgi:hypothetical protein